MKKTENKIAGCTIQRYANVLNTILALFIITTVLLKPAAAALNARVCVSKDSLNYFCKTDKVKLVFINNYRVYFVDFSESNPQIYQISKLDTALPAISPDISPHGEKMTFATGVKAELTTALSTAWVCDFSANAVPVSTASPGYVPRFVKNTEKNKQQIIYSTKASALAGKSYIWDGSGAVVKKDLASGKIDTVCSSGSFIGGLSWDNTYLATAEGSACAFILNTKNPFAGPSHLHRMAVKTSSTNKDTVIDVRSCNPSVSSSRLFTSYMMFFDFSSTEILDCGCYHPELGNWGFHDRIFIYNDKNQYVKYFDVPADIVTSTNPKNGEKYGKNWNFPEWSNHPYYGIATAEIARFWSENGSDKRILTSKNEALYIVDLKDSAYIRIVETTDTGQASLTDMRWPALWVEVSDTFQNIEDQKWLQKNTAIKNKSSEFLINKGDFLVRKNVIVSRYIIKSVALYSLNGCKVWYAHNTHSKSVRIPHSLAEGIYAVQCTLPGRQCVSFKYIHTGLQQ